MVRLPSTSLRTSRSPQGKILKNLRALLLVLPLLFSIFTLLSLGPAVPKAQAAVCPDFLDGSQATSDLAVNPNKVRELDVIGMYCSGPDTILNQIRCFLARFWAEYLDIGDLALQNSRMPAYLRQANELTLSGELTDREEPGGITGALAKGLSPGYTQDGLDPIKELTESEGQLVTGTVTLNQVAPQEQFTTMPTYAEKDTKTGAPPGYYELKTAGKTGKALLQDYQVEGRFGEVAPLYDRFGLLKQMLFPPAGKTTKAAIPTVDCINYDPTIIAIRRTTGFDVADPDRKADWQAYVPVPAADQVVTVLQCTSTTSICPRGASNRASAVQCATGCTGICVNDLNGVRKCCYSYPAAAGSCPNGTSTYPTAIQCSTSCSGSCISSKSGIRRCCSYFTTTNSCPPTPGDKSYELGGNLDVQSKVSYASKAWERIGAPSTAPGEGGVFNVLLPPGSSFLTKEAEPQLDFDYDTYSPLADYSDNSTLNIADLGNVGGATSCIVNQLTAHPANAAYGTCEAAFGGGGFGPITCTDEATPLTFPNTAGAGAGRAWEIVNNLYQGFWCLWNWSKIDYPEIFDEAEYRRDPNPPFSYYSVHYIKMFWCTELVRQIYDTSLSLISEDMARQFGALGPQGGPYQSNGRFISISGATWQNIQPGYVIFFIVPGSTSYRLNHVGIVYSVSSDSIRIVQSNAGEKDMVIPVGDDGKISPTVGRFRVMGFGRP